MSPEMETALGRAMLKLAREEKQMPALPGDHRPTDARVGEVVKALGSGTLSRLGLQQAMRRGERVTDRLVRDALAEGLIVRQQDARPSQPHSFVFALTSKGWDHLMAMEEE